jgi:hypothetical protein
MAAAHQHGAGWVLARPLRQPAPGTRTRPQISQPQRNPSSPSRISRHWPTPSSFVLAASRLRALQLDPGRAARRPGQLRGRIQKNSQPGGARSHRVRSVRPLDTGGPYGCRRQGLPDCRCAGTSVRRCMPHGVRHPDGETDRRSRRRGRAAGTRPGRSDAASVLDLDPGPEMGTSPGSSSGPEPGGRPCLGTPRRSRPPRSRPPGRRRMRLPGASIFLFRHHAERRGRSGRTHAYPPDAHSGTGPGRPCRRRDRGGPGGAGRLGDGKRGRARRRHHLGGDAGYWQAGQAGDFPRPGSRRRDAGGRLPGR